MKWQEVLPVFISIIVIILVAVVEKQSRFIAAITATMPLTAPLAIWIVYTASQGDSKTITQFNQGLILGVIPTIGFLIAVWFAARAEVRIGPMLLLGYGVWGAVLALIFLIRKSLGLS